jgi:hypothetical protein
MPKTTAFPHAIEHKELLLVFKSVLCLPNAHTQTQKALIIKYGRAVTRPVHAVCACPRPAHSLSSLALALFIFFRL